MPLNGLRLTLSQHSRFFWCTTRFCLLTPSTRQRLLVSSNFPSSIPTTVLQQQRTIFPGRPKATIANSGFTQKKIASTGESRGGKMSDYKALPDSLSNSHLQPGAPWGFVVVRAVYGASSDSAWTQMLDHLCSSVAEALELNGDSVLLQKFELTSIQDEAKLNGADSHAARRAFRAWVADDLPPRLRAEYLEQYGGTTQVRAKLLSNDPWHDNHPVERVPPRWQYCLFVDEDCLRSLSHSSQSPTVKFLTTNWEPESTGAPTETFTHDWIGGATDSGTEDVGWMFLDVDSIVHAYDRCIDPYNWDIFYERPYKSWLDDPNTAEEGARTRE
ncbi:hypothetical protein IQ07DRAFT_287872 [Pyrenochaeta sp. DS3sAY3a]|nr:hypothetical protein IQ07DRAFT_287872 [Pyrenochaeta sp. DS3sAY3a]